HIGKSTERFFVLEENNDESVAAWEHRRIRMASSIGNGIKENYLKTSKTDLAAFVESSSRDTVKTGILLDPNRKRRKKSVLLLSLTALGNLTKTRPGGKTTDRKGASRRSLSEQPREADEKDIVTAIKETVVAMTNRGRRRRFGIGIVGEFFERKVRGSIIKSVKPQIDNLDDNRPYFSYWVTFVQTVIMLTAIIVYGHAPIGIGVSTVTGSVDMPNLAIQTEHRMEVENLWIGPRQVLMSLQLTPPSTCLRFVPFTCGVGVIIVWDLRMQSIYFLGLGELKYLLSGTWGNVLSTWLKWSSDNPGPDGRVSGSVCGQDPRYCNNPSSSAPFDWPDEITKWPICQETTPINQSLAHMKNRHMHCELLGRPCCTGIQGECIITTVDHCQLLRGFFHGEAALCSQVNCIQEICGMIPFAQEKMPDQFYRLFSSLFLHGGVVHLGMSIVFQMWIMRDLEKLLGTIRMITIYFGSGVAGNLASCTFLPYAVEVGPSGAHFGVAACLFVEVIQSYQMFKHPHLAIMKLCLPIGLLFLLGLFPWVDNWAHLFGFFFGFLLAFSLMPYVTFGHFDRRRKLITVFACLGASVVLFAMLIVIFYFAPLTDCQWCLYFNCIPLTAEFCDNMSVRLKTNSSYYKLV
ncbi:unnamed protein product, partial [Candidula unifasciata]